jgi:hypothetical protein
VVTLTQPAPAPAPKASDLSARIALARGQMTDAVVLAGLREDPYRHVIEATGQYLALLAEVADRLEETRSPLSAESTRMLIAQTSTKAALAMTSKVEPLMATLRWQAWARIGLVLAVIMLLCVGATLYLDRLAPHCEVLSDGHRWCEM